MLCWLVGTPAALLVVRLLDLDPLTLRGSIVPVAVGAVVAAGALAVAARFVSERLTGAAAGLYAAWIAMVLLNALHGTPFGHNELYNWDTIRMSALANRLSTTWASADAFVPGLPAEYPVLYPWLIGRASNLLEQPTWTLVGHAEVLFISGSVVAAFVLWRRLVSSPIALGMAAVAPVVFMHGHKSYEILTLAVFVPWVLATFAGLPRRSGGMHWLLAGVIGGLFVLTYTGYLMFGSIGVLAVIGARLLRPQRAPYLLHLLGVLVTATVVSSWYVGPLLYGYLTQARNVVADTYPNAEIPEDPLPLPFLDPTVLGALSLVGLVGLFWYRKREWWAQPILLLTCGVYLYLLVFTMRLVHDGHSGFLVKTPRMVEMLLVTAGILTIARAAGPAWRKLGLVPPRAVGVAALAVLLVSSGLTAWREWTPGSPRGFKDVLPAVSGADVDPNSALYAHMEPLPNGDRTRFAPDEPRRPVMPAQAIGRAVEDRLGADALPMTLSVDMRLFVYLPWYAYEQRGGYSANSLMRYTDRYDELRKLRSITDPARFAEASAHTRFGGIDVFVLRDRGDEWRFDPWIGFQPRVFREGPFEIVEDLPSDLVLAIRTG